MTAAGIVLAGGRSVRMGAPKATLSWGGSTLLRRAVGIVGRAVDGPIVVVKAADQRLAPLPEGVEVAQDARPGRGPLQGIAAGLATVAGRADVAYVSGVDSPFAHPAFIRHVVRSLDGDHDVALPHAHGFDHPLAAAYRISAQEQIEPLITSGALALGALIERLRARLLDERALLADPALAALDPELDSLRNVNTPDEYDAARAAPAPLVTVRCKGALRSRCPDPITLRVATVGAAATTVGVELGSEGVAILDGELVVDDPQEPLAAGDSVIFTAPS